MLCVSLPSARNTFQPQRCSLIRSLTISAKLVGVGLVSAVDSRGRTIFVADAHSGDGKRFVVRAEEKLTPFLELESANSASDVSL
jgi:hypothetical protein